MNLAQSESPDAITSQAQAKTFSIGTLVYTRAGLISLFGWLLWGDFVFCMMQGVMPRLLPLILQSNGASTIQISVIASTIAMAMNAIMNPIISYQSDRFRSRWGRRRPFIFLTTPFVVLFLSAVPFAPEILHWLGGSSLVMRLFSMGPVPPLILMFAILVVGFQAFNLFIASVYYYLIPDVVPKDLLGRFYGLFRLFSQLAGAAFNFFILGQAETHMRMVFVSIAVVYGVFIMLMCWQVKEGEYPPLPEESHGHWWSGIQNYAKECFGCSYYWWVYLSYTTMVGVACADVFSTLFLRDELGMSLDFIGKTVGYSMLFSAILCYPFGVIIDRWGSHKTLITSMALSGLWLLLEFFFAQGKWSGAFFEFLRVAPLTLYGMAVMKWAADVYPHDQYGQFCSAGQLFCSVCGIVLGPVCGYFIGWMTHYRYLLAWQSFALLAGAAVSIVVYRKWKALGGPNHYQPIV